MGTASMTYGKKVEPKNANHTPPSRVPEKKVAIGQVEGRRLMQLLVCVVLFLTIFVGQGILPAQMEAITPTIARLLSSETNVATLVTQVRQSVAQGDSITTILGGVKDSLFFGESMELSQDSGVDGSIYLPQIQRLTSLDPEGNFMAQYLGIDLDQYAVTVPLEEEFITEELLEGSEIAEEIPVEEPLITPVEYEGIPLPDNVTMDYYSLSVLGVGETITPVDGTASSGFGWRVHPIYEEMSFHYGFDIAADTGTAIGAFADGTVDYIGENDDYGLYVQISHEGGLTSFYAHCSELLVQAGQTVTVGETVALVGSTGVSTGPHLHLELKVDGLFINPGYYVECAAYA